MVLRVPPMRKQAEAEALTATAVLRSEVASIKITMVLTSNFASPLCRNSFYSYLSNDKSDVGLEPHYNTSTTRPCTL